MATVDTRSVAEAGGEPGGSPYDGFISYSHAADDLLAPRLQAGLQRFAKPWWKRRALRIFRDESSLSANPHLWSSITDALDGSDWFVLLLSPEAASSEWVNQEVDYWVANKDAERIIPVLTDGDFGWANGDVTGDAVPPALHGVFSDEPRWVDVRFARDDEQLDLQDPRFADAVADIAAAIRQVPKDELASEEVKQHRRTVRTAWGAGVVVLLLAIAATGAALFALDQRNDARSQASIAKGRELTLEAEKVVDSNPELSIHLALAALAELDDTTEDPAQAVTALRAGIAADRLLYRIPAGGFVGVHPRETLLVTWDEETPGGVVIWDYVSGRDVERYDRPGVEPWDAAFSPDGNLVAVAYSNLRETEFPLTIWNRPNGASFDLGSIGADTAGIPVFSPDGRYVAFETYSESNERDTVEVWSIDEPALLYRDDGWGPDFSADGLLSYAGPDDRSKLYVVDLATGERIHTLTSDVRLHETGWSPDGEKIAVHVSPHGVPIGEVITFDVMSEKEISRTTIDGQLAGSPAWLDNETFVLGGSPGPRVFDASSGEIVLELPPVMEFGFYVDVVPGTTSVAVADAVGGKTIVFDASQLGGLEVGGWLAPLDVWRAEFADDGANVVIGANPGLFDNDEPQPVYAVAGATDGRKLRTFSGVPYDWWIDPPENGEYVAASGDDGVWRTYSTSTDANIYEAPAGWAIHGVSWDGSRAVIAAPECESTRLVSTLDQSVDTEIDSSSECPSRAFFSPDGSVVFIPFDNLFEMFDAKNGDLLADLTDSGCWGFVAFTPDSQEVVIGSDHLCVADLDALKAGAPVEDVARQLTTDPVNRPWRLSISPHGNMLATGAPGERLKLWDLATGDLLAELGDVAPVFHDADFHPTEPWLLVTTLPNEVRIYTLDLEELIEIAKSRLSREMTDDECLQYFREPCPAP